MLLIDHEENSNPAAECKRSTDEVQQTIGKELAAFEVTSTKEAAMTWYSNLRLL